MISILRTGALCAGIAWHTGKAIPALSLVLLASAVSGCATATPVTTIHATAVSKSQGAATIAMWGSWEWELAPAYTRLAMLRRSAAAQLSDGRISLAAAKGIQAAADRARWQLDSSRRGNAAEPAPSQRTAYAEALRTIEVGESLLEP